MAIIAPRQSLLGALTGQVNICTFRSYHVGIHSHLMVLPNTITANTDYGNFSYYAGPVGVYGKGHCIAAFGVIQWKGVYYTIDTNPWVGHYG